MRENDKKVKDYLEKPEIPEELSPENIRKMLDEKAPAKKRRSRITAAGRVTAAAAACAVIAGSTFGASKFLVKRGGSADLSEPAVSRVESGDAPAEDDPPEIATSHAQVTEEQKNAPYMSGAESYEQVYKLMEKAWEDRKIYFDSLDIATNDVEYAADASEETVKSEAPMAAAGAGMGGDDSGSREDPYYIPEVPEPTDAPADPTAPATEPVTEPASGEHTDPTLPPEPTAADPTEPTTEETTEPTTETEDHSETHNQEENVLEADIVKTDGRYIYYIYNDRYNGDDLGYASSRVYNAPRLDVAEVSKGKFGEHTQISLDPLTYPAEDGWHTDIYVMDMYLYNDMLAVIGYQSSWRNGGITSYDEDTYCLKPDYHDCENESESFVSFYTTGTDPQLIGTYRQDGSYSDVRIAPDGYMYFVTEYNSWYFDNIDSFDDIDKYIPQYGVDEVECVHPDDILLPVDDLDNANVLSYIVIGSIDLNTAGEFSPCEIKALAGYTGNLYSSANNLYTAVGWDETSITRIAIGNGVIAPEASCTVKGYVNDQFSMSEYNGFFRVATTINVWEDHSNFITDLFDIPTDYEHIHENCLYVLDMDLNEVGRLEGFGEEENIKSVRFSGNTAYVVTFMQTDPLFAIDLRDPADPVITDEFKITGYSAYMQQWDEGHLLGFGVNADEQGWQTGLKLTMFDNADPYNLQEVGTVVMESERDGEYLDSGAMWDRKALFIAPEKNVIGVPLTIMEYNWDEGWESITQGFRFFSYGNGGFTELGDIKVQNTYGFDDYTNRFVEKFNRVVYVGDYLCVLSGDTFVSVDIATFDRVDEIRFK